MEIQESELILNADGSIYHLNLKPENIGDIIIFVGDPYRVEKITTYFDAVTFETQKREFKTQTGVYKGKSLSVISTGIGSGNIDIVMNELDALVNVNLATGKPKKERVCLSIIRIGTSGALQRNVPVGSFLMSTYGLDLTGTLYAYKTDEISYSELITAFMHHMNWHNGRIVPQCIKNHDGLEKKIDSHLVLKGITATASGFYGPQGRVLRLPLADPHLNEKICSFTYDNKWITNFEMETATLYGLSKLLGHAAISMSAIIANRIRGEFSKTPDVIIDQLIRYTLEKITA